MSCDSFAFFPLLSLVSYRQNFKQTKCINKSVMELSVCSLVRSHSSQIPSPSAVCQTIWTLPDLYVSSSCWAVCSSAQKSRSCSMWTLDFCLTRQTAVCLLSSPRLIMHSTAGYRSWFSPNMHFCLHLGLIEVRSCSYNKQTRIRL